MLMLNRLQHVIATGNSKACEVYVSLRHAGPVKAIPLLLYAEKIIEFLRRIIFTSRSSILFSSFYYCSSHAIVLRSFSNLHELKIRKRL